MKEHTAQELEGHRIRIQSFGKIPVGHRIQITDLDTDEPVLNVATIDLHIVPREVITARLELLSIGKLVEQPDGGFQASLRSELLTVHNPELDLTAFVVEES